MILYLIKSTLCLTLMIAAYHLLLARAGTFRFNRFFLLFGICFSLAIPRIEMETWKEAIPDHAPIASTIIELEHQVVFFENHEILTPLPEGKKIDAKSNLGMFLLSIYIMVVLILIIRYAGIIKKLLRQTNSTVIIYHEGVKIILLNENLTPHSFLNHIFIWKEDYRNGISSELLTHELAHVQQKHSWDIMFVEFVKIIFWFNPILNMYARAIRMNHEYLADQTVIDNHKNVSDYQQQLIQYLSRFKSPSFASQLNYSLTKKRFKMMKKKITKSAAVISITALIPIVIIAMMAFSPAIKKVEKSIETGVAQIETFIKPEVLVEENSTPSISPLNKTDIKRVSSGFGKRINPFTKEEEMHFGLDFSADIGVDVLATADGVIAIAKSEKYGYGNHVRINHGNEYETLYAHMHELKVSEGKKVKMGDVIGTVGSTGRSFAPHLHYAVTKNEKHVNPSLFIKDDKLSVSNIKEKLVSVYGLKRRHNFWNLSPKTNQVQLKIAFDDSLVVLFENNLENVKVKQVDVIMNQLKVIYQDLDESLASLVLAPPPPPQPRSASKEMVNQWSDSTVYGVWIDGLRMKNSAMTGFDASDFYFYFKSGLERNAKNYGNHEFQLNLYTEEYYNQTFMPNTYQERMRTWREMHAALLKLLTE